MPDTTVRGVHINAVLTNLSIGYHPSGMIAERVVPVVPVKKESDFYYVWNRGDAFRIPETRRPDGDRANAVDFGFTRDSYLCDEYALETRITDRQRDNADSVLSLELAKTRRTQDLIALAMEKRVAQMLTDPNSYAATNVVTLSGTNQWNNASFAGSIEQVFDGAKEAIRLQTGGVAQAALAIIPRPVAQVIKRDAKVRDILKYTHSDLLVDGELPPRIWNLEVVIPTAVESVDREVYGVDSATLQDVWGKHVVVLHRPSAPAIDTLAFAYIFRARDWTVEQWRDEPTSCTWYRVSIVQAEKVVSKYAGYLIQNAIS